MGQGAGALCPFASGLQQITHCARAGGNILSQTLDRGAACQRHKGDQGHRQ